MKFTGWQFVTIAALLPIIGGCARQAIQPATGLVDTGRTKDNVADYFPLRVGSTWSYRIIVPVRAVPVWQESQEWSNGKVVHEVKRMRVPGGAFHEDNLVVLRYHVAGSFLEESGSLERFRISVDQDEDGMYRECNDISWIVESGDHGKVYQRLNYDGRTTPHEPVLNGWAAHDDVGKATRNLFFIGAPGDSMPAGAGETLTFVGVEPMPDGQIARHYVRRVDFAPKAGPPGPLYSPFTEDTWFVKGKGMARMEQRIGGALSMTWVLDNYDVREIESDNASVLKQLVSTLNTPNALESLPAITVDHSRDPYLGAPTISQTVWDWNEKDGMNARRDVRAAKLSKRGNMWIVLVPAGWFWMGTYVQNELDNTQGGKFLPDYWIGMTPVTVDQFRAYCKEKRIDFSRFREPVGGWIGDHPMVGVTWQQARDFCHWAGGELPTEAQWEKAARATDARQYPWGDDWDSTRLQWSPDDNGSAKTTASVAAHPTGISPYGCLDMAGNVCQWCLDNFGGTGSGETHVLKGGSWYHRYPVYFRSAIRYPDLKPEVVGFRVAFSR